MTGFRKWQWVAGAAVSAAALAGGIAIWSGSQALKISRQEFQAERESAFTFGQYGPPRNSRFEPVRSPEVFARLARFQDRLYVAGPAGLSEYDSRGGFLREFPAGSYLPGSPLVAMEVGQFPGVNQPELILVTANHGILTFDGERFHQLYPQNPEVRSITAILPTGGGHLLIGTKKRGVLVYDGKTIRELHPTLGHLYVRALAGSETDLWVGTQDQGVKHWHSGTTETFGEQELPDRQVQAIALAGEKTFVGTPLGVVEFSGSRFSRVLAKNALVTSLRIQADNLWVGTEDQGVLQVPLAPGQRLSAPRHLLSAELGEVLQIENTEEGVLVLTREGVFDTRANGLGWHQVLKSRDAVLSDRNISALAIDQDGRLWVGYFDRGLDIVPTTPQRAVHVENEHVFCVNRILPEPKANSVEVATANGLVRFGVSGKPKQVLGTADGLIADHVTDIAPYRDGLAIATPAGITFLDSEGARSMYTFHGLVNNHVYTLAAFDDELMVGTLGGLSALQKEMVKANFTAGNSGLKQNWITAIARVGDEWMVGTYGSGVMGLDSAGRFHPYQIATAPVEINSNALLVTKERVFAGTLGQGLYVYDRSSQRWEILKEGLPSENVTAFATGNGYIYVGTDNGLVRLQESKIQP